MALGQYEWRVIKLHGDVALGQYEWSFIKLHGDVALGQCEWRVIKLHGDVTLGQYEWRVVQLHGEVQLPRQQVTPFICEARPIVDFSPRQLCCRTYPSVQLRWLKRKSKRPR